MGSHGSIAVSAFVIFTLFTCVWKASTQDLDENDKVSKREQLINKFKVDLHHFLEAERIRTKREAEFIGALTDENKFLSSHIRVASSTPEVLPYLADYNLTFWTPIRHGDTTQVLIGTKSGDLVLLDLEGKIANPVAQSLGEIIGYKAKAFSYDNEQWFAILQSTPNETRIRLYQRIGRGLERRQTISLDGKADFDLVTVKGIHYLAVTTFFTKTEAGYSYQANVALYHWTRTQFDVVATRITRGPKSLACWVLDGSLYLSVAQAINDDKNLNLGSPVFVYNAKEESNLVLIETLSTKSPTKCAHFVVGGSHYLIFIGHMDASIYWWAGNQFLELQQITGTAGASDVAVLDLPNKEIVIVISVKDDILFLTLDTTGYYMVTFTMNFSGRTISSTQFIFDTEDYHALILFEEPLLDGPYAMYKLSLKEYYLPKVNAMDPLLQCLSKLTSSLQERKAKIQTFETDMEKIWLTNKHQMITAPVVIHGPVAVKGRPLLADTVAIGVKQPLLPLTTEKHVENIASNLSTLQKDIEIQLQNVVLKSTDQEIRGDKELRGTVRLQHLAIDNLTSDVFLNGISVAHLLQNTLKNSGNQEFRGSLYVRDISVETILSHKLNDISINDFLLLGGDQSVTGDLTFGNVRGTDIDMGPLGILNGVPLGRYVTNNRDQAIEGLKTFQMLKADIVDVQGTTNGVDLNELQRNVITINEDHVIKGSLEIKRPMKVTGDILISGLINHAINISKLGSEAVDKNSDQEVTGTKVFASLTVNGNLVIEGRTNGIDLDKEVLTVSTDQEINRDVTFLSPVTFSKDLRTNLVNGIDLEKRCVVLRGDVSVLGHKTFSSLITDHIGMDEGVKLDDVDPSELASVMVQHDSGVVKDSTVLSGVFVLGNLTAQQGINGINIGDLPNLVYLKSVSQMVDTPVLFRGILTMDDTLEATLINNLSLTSDVIHTRGDEEILSNKIFEDYVMVQNDLKLGPGALLNGIDVSSLHQENVPGQAIHGKKTFTSLEVYGNIEVSDVQNFEFLANVMHTKGHQIVTGCGGEMWPSSLTIHGNLLANEVIPVQVNGIDFGHFVSNAVMKNNPEERRITRKTFADLEASSLSLSSESRIDGVLIPEMLLSAVSLNTPQYIEAEKSFIGPLQFSNSLTAEKVNGMNLVQVLDNVVLTNRDEIIGGKKTIRGNTEVENVAVEGLINGVNLTSLASVAVYKSRANELLDHVTFLDDVDIGSLVVSENSLVDGVFLSDVARTDKDEYLGNVTFASEQRMTKNVSVHGLVNGCDLHEVLARALVTSSPEQIIDGNFEIDSLNIIGDVWLEGTINGMEVDDLFSDTVKAGDYVMSGNFYIDSTLAAHNLNLKGPVQGMDVNYFMQDAVRKSIPQEITGYKLFNDDLEIGVLQSRQNLLVLGDLNNIDFNKMIQDTVWKKHFQVIYGSKTFNRIYANDVTVHGYLNDIKLPQDVVLVNASDVIPGQVFMKDLVLKSNLLVAGRIDGIELNDLLGRRVTLKGDETLAGSVIFKHKVDVKGEMTVDGMINDIALEMVVQRNRKNVISGRKRFANDLVVQGFLQTDLINDIDVKELSRSIIRTNRDEILNTHLVFASPLYILNSLTVDLINGVSIMSLRKSFEEAKSKDSADQESLHEIEKDVGDNLKWQGTLGFSKISVYAYFIKVQELNFGPTSRIQIGYEARTYGEPSVDTLMMWINRPICESPGQCCDKLYTYFLRPNDEGDVTVSREPEAGRYFPINGPYLFPSDRRFVMWTNTTVAVQPTWCQSNDSQDTVFGSFGSNGIRKSLLVKNSPLLMDVKSFRDGHLFLVAAFFSDKTKVYYSKSAVYRYDEERGEWEEHQVLNHGILCMDITQSDIFLALGSATGSYPNSALIIYAWNKHTKKFNTIKSIPSNYVTSLTWIDQGKDKLLAAASVNQLPDLGQRCNKVGSGGEVNVYRYGDNFQWIQSIQLPAVMSIVSFSVSGDTYLAAAGHQTETIYILQWRGYSKFTVIQTIFSAGVRHLNVFRRQNELYMAVSSISGPSQILKALVRGEGNYQIKDDDDDYSDQREINDAEVATDSIQAQNC